MSDRTPFDHFAGPQRETEMLLIAHDPAHRETALAAAAVTGVGLATVAPSTVFAGERQVDIVVVDIRGCEDGEADALLHEVETAMRAAPMRAIVALSDAQIDLAAAILFAPMPVRHLIDPDIVAFATALAEARGGPEFRARENERDAARLRRLNEEVARIADALARLARETAAASGGAESEAASYGVRDFARTYAAPPSAQGTSASAEVRGAIRARRMRGQFFEPELFADPAWDMLLDLYAAEREGGQVSVSSLCIAAAVPGTTALRWIASLTETGLFARRADPADRRRAFIALEPMASAGMAAYFAAIRAAGLASA